ncbi:MAG: hypothetical protein L3J95_00710 [Thermoplasmata archaeon]|nr:hypothetical protein [Thermoplasmata archaeon]MCI4358940.1 hypothetical protein [Thermoplasmata archaeon]
MSAPWPVLGEGIVPFLLVFGLMLTGNGYVVLRLFPRSGRPATLADATVLIGILLMGMGLWLALIYAVLDPGDASEVSVFIALNSMMAVVGCWAIALFLRAESRSMTGPRWRWPAVFALLLVGNEILMGAAFVLAESGPAAYTTAGWTGLVSLLGDSLTSVWFYWAMLANMVLFLLQLPLDRPSRTALGTLAATGAVGPWLVIAPLEAGVAMALIMSWALVATLTEWRSRPLSQDHVRALEVVWFAFALMSVGEGAFLLEPAPAWKGLWLGLATVVAMGGELLYLLGWGLDLRGRPFPSARLASPRKTSSPPILGN